MPNKSVKTIEDIGGDLQQFTSFQSVSPPVAFEFMAMIGAAQPAHVEMGALERISLEAVRFVIGSVRHARVSNAPQFEPALRSQRLTMHEPSPDVL